MRIQTLTPVAGFRPLLGADQSMGSFELAKNASMAGPNWPPHNLTTADEDRYRIVLAVPGFKDADLEIISEPNRLTVTGTPRTSEAYGEVVFRGIRAEPFRRTYALAEHVRVDQARLGDGLLTIDLVRDIPEGLKPRRIEIDCSAGQNARHAF